jgi:catechol 2,3-dioxygenase-like lactoylglutathione lyase family enzyme
MADVEDTVAEFDVVEFTEPVDDAPAGARGGALEVRSDDKAMVERVEEEVIPVLYVEDAARTVAWYGRLGFHKQWEHQFEPGFPLFVSVARGRVRLYLSEHKGDARPNTLIHLNVADIDAVAAEFGMTVDEAGLAGRECHLEDPDGNRLRVATPRS